MDTMARRSGFENVCEDEDFKTKPYVLHAEANAITKVAKSNNSSDGSTLVHYHVTVYGMCQADHSKRHTAGWYFATSTAWRME